MSLKALKFISVFLPNIYTLGDSYYYCQGTIKINTFATNYTNTKEKFRTKKEFSVFFCLEIRLYKNYSTNLLNYLIA